MAAATAARLQRGRRSGPSRRRTAGVADSFAAAPQTRPARASPCRPAGAGRVALSRRAGPAGAGQSRTARPMYFTVSPGITPPPPRLGTGPILEGRWLAEGPDQARRLDQDACQDMEASRALTSTGAVQASGPSARERQRCSRWRGCWHGRQ